jgi:hypothetical protein
VDRARGRPEPLARARRPTGDARFTQVYAGSAIFSFTPCTEEVARDAARRFRVSPPKVLGVTPPSRQLVGAEPPDAEVIGDSAAADDCLDGDDCADPDCNLAHPDPDETT